MKKLLLFFIVPAVVVSCTNSPDIGAPRAASQAGDTAGLAEFHLWKAKQAEATKPNTVYIVREAPERVNNRVSQPVYTPTPSSPEVVNDVPGASQPEQQQKKGWSAKAKGAVIGAAVGGLAGAVWADKNEAANATT